MRYSDILLTEKAIRIDADGHPVTVIENPSIQQVLNLLERSPDEQVKGLIIGSDVFFWSATSVATHGHIAQQLWPTDGHRNYWEYPEYVDGRLLIEMDDGHPTIDFEPSLFDNPRVFALLKSDQIYFNFPGAGFMNYSEYVANTKENEKRDIARKERMRAYDAQRQAPLKEIDRGGELNDDDFWGKIKQHDFEPKQDDMFDDTKDYEFQGRFDGIDVAVMNYELQSNSETSYVLFRGSATIAYATLEPFRASDNDYQVKAIRIAPSEQGKGLAPRFYRWLLTDGNTNRLYADEQQTDGGAKIWERLLAVPGIGVFAAKDDESDEPQGRRVRTVKGMMKVWETDGYCLYAEAV
jgi:hypothetical protein